MIILMVTESQLGEVGVKLKMEMSVDFECASAYLKCNK